MIAFLDVNTIWRRKFADALQRRVPETVRYAPYSGKAPVGETGDVGIALPRGWAGPLAWLAMPLLLRRVRRDGPPRAIILTTPHYLRLAQKGAAGAAIVYYCSDDYRSYAGWDPARMARDEAALCRIARASIFVSETLRARAVTEYGLDPEKAFISPNATERRFAQATEAPVEMADMPGPVFGAGGVFNQRIDTAFLAGIADDPRVGSLALVGPIEVDLADDAGIARLRANPKVRFFGPQPHARMPAWMGAFDVAVIPYANTEFNRFCSPMRLHDHRAIGQPIIATPHCAQVEAYPDVLTGTADRIPELVEQAIGRLGAGRDHRIETWDDRVAALQKSEVAGFLFPQ